MKIPHDILLINEKFVQAKKELFLVGGCVRDFHLGLDPKDFDMATDAIPDEVEQILTGFKLDFTGKHFGVIRVYTESEKKGYEIATYRTDESTGRKPKVNIGATIKDDAERRDFTINALYYDINKNCVFDIVNGIDDLNNKVIRANGDPIKRINEDALRILRAIRFKNSIGGELSGDLSEAISKNPTLQSPDGNGNMILIAQERIAEEFLKGVEKSLNVNSYVKDLIHYNIVGQIFPNLGISDPISKSKNPAIIIAELMRHNTDKNNLLFKLVSSSKFSSKLATNVVFLLKLHGLDEDTAYQLKKSFQKTDLKVDDVLEYGSLIGTIDPIYLTRSRYIEAFTKYNLTVDGNKLKEEGFIDGPLLGKEIERREKELFVKLLSSI